MIRDKAIFDSHQWHYSTIIIIISIIINPHHHSSLPLSILIIIIIIISIIIINDQSPSSILIIDVIINPHHRSSSSILIIDVIINTHHRCHHQSSSSILIINPHHRCHHHCHQYCHHHCHCHRQSRRHHMSAEFDTRSHLAYHENFITWSTQLPCQEKRSMMFALHTHNCDFARLLVWRTPTNTGRLLYVDSLYHVSTFSIICCAEFILIMPVCCSQSPRLRVASWSSDVTCRLY